MRKFSRWMPALPACKTPWWGWIVWVLVVAAVVNLIYQVPWILLVAIAAVPLGKWSEAKAARRLRAWALQRSHRSICTFAREFDFRRTDAWILRAVYEEISRYLAVDGRPVPVGADERWAEDLQIDPEDLEDLLSDIAFRAGRTLENAAENPFLQKMETIRDLVNFLEWQPRTLPRGH